MKRVVLCDNHCYHISDEDYEVLRQVSPGYARLVKESDADSPTHFVCEHCGQVPPVKLRELHECKGTGNREQGTEGTRHPSGYD